MSSSPKTAAPIKAFIFDHIEEDMPLFLELFAKDARELASLEAAYDRIESPDFFDDNYSVYICCSPLPKKIDWSLLKQTTVPIYLFFPKGLKEMHNIECHNFSNEKPWERQKRLFQWIDHFCQKQKKTLQKEAFDRLFRITEGFGLAILRHVEQILLTLKTPTITLETLAKHHLHEVGMNDWERARELLFSPKHSLRPEGLDMLGFLSKLRQEVYYNLFSFEIEPKILIPPFRKKELKEKEPLRLRLGQSYFLALLPLLLEIEVLAKSASATQNLLFDMLFTKILRMQADFTS